MDKLVDKIEKLEKLIRAVINNQSAHKQELLEKITKSDKKMDVGFRKQTQERNDLEKRLTKRLDQIGLQEARLEDDAPTIEEFDVLEKRVTKLEKSIAS